MKYRDIVLNGSDGLQFRLVKYSDRYNSCLDNFKDADKSLVECVRECPKIYSELSDHQSYMIFDNKQDICIGIVYIGTSCDERNLDVRLQLDESKFNNKNDMFVAINQIIDVLGYCFRDMDNIEVNMVSDIDLSGYDTKYKKMVYDAKLVTYMFANKINGKKRIYRGK